MFKKMRDKLVKKMVKKYKNVLGEKAESNVHQGVSCDGCGVSPIKGVRYNCTSCRNFDFCEKCEETAQHNPDHIFKKIKKPIDYNNGDYHRGITCDGCEMYPIKGIRYKCLTCPDFDFCEKCKANVKHEHPFKTIEKPVQRNCGNWRNRCGTNNNAETIQINNTVPSGEVFHRFVTCDGCRMSPIKGIRYKCLTCPNFDFCEKCKETVKHDHPFNKIEKPIERHCGNWRNRCFPGAAQNNNNNTVPSGEVFHRFVTCDGCGVSPIKGIRYKCLTCPNFDFCEKCKVAVKHDHPFQALDKPVERNFGHFRQMFENISNNFSNNNNTNTSSDVRENRCNFFKNLFQNFTQPKEEAKPQHDDIKIEKIEKKEESGYDFLVKDIKETYQLSQLDDKIILEALKKAEGDVEKAMSILFS